MKLIIQIEHYSISPVCHIIQAHPLVQVVVESINLDPDQDLQNETAKRETEDIIHQEEIVVKDTNAMIEDAAVHQKNIKVIYFEFLYNQFFIYLFLL